jgi:adenine-specific DNA methylase
MPYTFDQSKDQIAHLVRHFTANRAAFLSPAYKEARARQEFIDPLFLALNWDVRNEQQTAPDYREVIIEDSLEMEGHEARKAPDYVFRVGRERKFFAEAKKPGVDLKTAVSPAYQLRRYAWSAKLPLSVLTDFHEWAVYDCRLRPSQGDKSSTARLAYLTYEEYADRWREVWDVFSREAVWGGSFDQYAKAGKGKRGTSEVDAEFLKEIEGWRTLLAHNIAIRNPKLTIDELNDAVQRTIDRIIFLRMAEDRGVEPYGRLQRIAGGEDAYAGLIKVCRQADARYNSGLFDFSKAGDRVTPDLAVDDKVLKSILSGLYFPQSPYEFSVLPAEILGNVYEQFLGKVIRLTAGHQAKVEEKPEVKKAGGVYYTPAYIVNYIVKNTVGKQVEGKSPKQLKGFRVLDMACGSGSFLLGAYQCLLDYYLAWYTANDPQKHPNAVWHLGDAWKLTTTEKKRILTEHIFGVDIDRQAVEVTKLSLLLKVLEGKSDESLNRQAQMALLPERALPNLDKNIKCGNSLIGPDYFTGQLMPDADELRRVNPFDWQKEFPDAMQAGGFDAVIGNPPYIRIQTLKEWAPLEVEAYKQLYKVAGAGNYDIYVVFVEKGKSLLNKRGRLGFILPSKFFSTDYGDALRRLIIDQKALSEIIDFGHAQVFENATTYSCLLFLSAAPTENVSYAEVAPSTQLPIAQIPFRAIDSSTLTSKPWLFSTMAENGLAEKLMRNSVALGDLPARIGRGSSSGADAVYILRQEKKSLTTREGNETTVESDILRVPIYATDFSRYSFQPQSGEKIIFPYEVTANGYQLFNEAVIRQRFPKAYKYLQSRRRELDARKQFKVWYSFSAPRNLDVHETAQILVPLLADRGLYCRLPNESSKYCLMASGGFSITVGVESGLSTNYVLGLLNSRLLFWRLHSISNVFRGGWITCTKQYVETLPIRRINFSDPAEKSRHDKMVMLVEQMLDLHKRKTLVQDAAEQGRLQRLIDSTDNQIDALVYELYGLTPEEIAIVDGAK